MWSKGKAGGMIIRSSSCRRMALSGGRSLRLAVIAVGRLAKGLLLLMGACRALVVRMHAQLLSLEHWLGHLSSCEWGGLAIGLDLYFDLDSCGLLDWNVLAQLCLFLIARRGSELV